MIAILGVGFYLSDRKIHWLLCLNEVWKQHKEFPHYWVSSHGRIKSYTKNRGWKINVLDITHRGYNRILCCNKNVRKKYSMHRLVAEYFISEIKSETVNHKDFNKLNNRYTNLEWNTQLQNVQHSKLAGRRFMKPVIQRSMSGEFIKEWPSAYEVELTLGYFSTLISRCCYGKNKHHKQFKWEFKNEN